MNELLQYYAKYQKFINDLKPKDRLVALAMILGGVLFIWYVGFWSAEQKILTKKNREIKKVQADINLLKKQITLAEIKIADMQRLDAQKNIPNIDNNKSLNSNLMSVKNANTVLRDLLARMNNLALLQLYNLAPKEVQLKQGNTKVFEYGMIVKFTGDYFSTMEYLGLLEKLDWVIFWDKLEYKVLKYPLAEITLQLHVFSEKGDWFDV